MITIDRKDILKYEEIGEGKFGKVYRVNDSVAYKIYHGIILDRDGFHVNNPALNHAKRRLSRLKRMKQKLIYTDVLDDIIYINGRIGGISIPYYDGCVLAELKDSNYTLKKDIMLQLKRNHQELREHNIYPHDYHLRNIMYVDNQVKIIDLDDPLTYCCLFPNFLFNLISSSRINDVACDLFSDKHWFYDYRVQLLLERKWNHEIDNNKWLDGFFEEKEKITDYLFIDLDSDINSIKYYVDNHNVRVLLLVDKTDNSNEETLDYLERLRNQGILVYDIVDSNNIGMFTNNFPIKNKVMIKNSDIQQYQI